MTDIIGSSRLWEAHPQVMREVVHEVTELIAQLVADHRGRLIKSKGEGDSTFSVFEDPKSAIDAGASIQQELTARVWAKDLRISVRLAVHSGEAFSRSEDFFGTTINRCARIREAGHAGVVLVSNSTAELVKSQTLLRSLGVHRLRDLALPEEIWTPTLGDIPQLRTLSVQQNNLPVQLSPFVGREEALQSLRAHILKERMVTILGLGGVGKTRIVIQAGADMIDRFENGVWFVDLGSCRSIESIMQAFAAAISVGGIADTASIIEAIGETQKRLLIFDNAQDSVDDLRLVVEPLLLALPELHVVATSREALRLNSERIFRLQPLTTPVEGATLEEALQTESAALFVGRAKMKFEAFDLREDNLVAVVDILARLEGIPLAIEQAAALAGTLSPTEIAKSLRSTFNLLEEVDLQSGVRHKSLRATLTWSVQLLNESERELLIALAHIVGSFDHETAVALSPVHGLGGEACVRGIRTLLDKSLLMSVEAKDHMRFRLFEVVRQHAKELSIRSSDTYACLDAWAISCATACDSKLDSGEQAAAVDKLRFSTADLDQACLRLGEARSYRLVDLVWGLRRHWLREGRLEFGIKQLSRSLDLLEDEPRRGRFLNALGAFYWKAGRLAEAEQTYRQSLDLCTAAKDLEAEAAVLTNIAILAGERHDSSLAIEAYERSVHVFEALRDELRMGIALLNLGSELRDAKRLEDSVANLERSETTFRRLGDNSRLSLTLINLADTLVAMDKVEDAFDALAESFQLLSIVQDPYGVGVACMNVGQLLCAVEKRPEAYEILECAKAIVQSRTVELGNSNMIRIEEMQSLCGQKLSRSERRQIALRARARKLDSIINYARTLLDSNRSHS